MDIEGAECAALAGGEDVLFQQHRPSLFKIETAALEGDANHSTCVHRLAERYGYSVERTGGDTLLRPEESASKLVSGLRSRERGEHRRPADAIAAIAE